VPTEEFVTATSVCICTKDGGDIEDWLTLPAMRRDLGLAGKPLAHAYRYDGADHEF
jgi:hypothetical protein